MKRGTKLTPRIVREITGDWQRDIPSLGIHRPRQLLCRVGPLLIGVCLERDSGGDVYKPTFHTHCLCEAQSSITLSIARQLLAPRSGGPTFLPLHLHGEKHREFAVQMVSQSLLPLSRDLVFAQVKDAYADFIEQPGGWSQSVFLMRDLILMAAWARQSELAESLLGDCMRIPRDVLLSP